MHLKTNRRGWKGKVHCPDPFIGMAPIPGARGKHIFPIGEPIPMDYDNHRFHEVLRTPSDGKFSGPTFLTLGDSLTYADACCADEAFAYQLVNRLNGKALNAGINSYGLAKMLVTRTKSYFAPTRFDKRPSPFLIRSEGGGIVIHVSVFSQNLFSLEVSRHRYAPRVLKSYFTVLFQVGLPLFVYEYFHMIGHYVKRATLITPPPIAERTVVINFSFRDIATLCRNYSAQMIVIMLTENIPTVFSGTEWAIIRRVPGVRLIDGHQAMVKQLSEKTKKAYLDAYYYWRGSPPKHSDGHPNAADHKIIADTLGLAIYTRREQTGEQLNAVIP